MTAQVVDIDSRVASLRRSVERLQGLLSQAGDVGQLAMVEGELARRETELEALQGQPRVLADQVAPGTLDVHLAEDRALTLSEDTPGFVDGLQTGWAALVYAGRITLTALGLARRSSYPRHWPSACSAGCTGAARARRRRPSRLQSCDVNSR